MKNIRASFAVGLLLTSCGTEGPPGIPGLQGLPGPQGSQGSMGAMGSPGTVPTQTSCPDGYQQDTSVGNFVLCRKGADEVVKVGVGNSAFWVDRYEASVWSKADGTGTQYGAKGNDYPATFPVNGQATVLLYSISKVGVQPAQYITWFQANQACRASGKRLMYLDEWFAASYGTLNPGNSDGTNGACVTNAAGPRAAGAGTQCRSSWGAEDMIGSQWEWTAEWYAGVGQNNVTGSWVGTGFSGDGTWNIASLASVSGGNQNVPAATLRGGCFACGGTRSGIYAMYLAFSAGDQNISAGFRCVTPR